MDKNRYFFLNYNNLGAGLFLTIWTQYMNKFLKISVKICIGFKFNSIIAPEKKPRIPLSLPY